MQRVGSSAGLMLALSVLLAGCGTTKWSDSPRTATEQLLISDAIDRAISEIDFSVLADAKVYLDTRFIITVLDQNYVISTLRQHMLASGCIIQDKPDDATYVVEVRTGSIKTGLPPGQEPLAEIEPVVSALPDDVRAAEILINELARRAVIVKGHEAAVHLVSMPIAREEIILRLM